MNALNSFTANTNITVYEQPIATIVRPAVRANNYLVERIMTGHHASVEKRPSLVIRHVLDRCSSRVSRMSASGLVVHTVFHSP